MIVLLYKVALAHSNYVTKLKLIYLPSSMITSLLHFYHDNPLSGHFGARRTYLKIKNIFWWPNVNKPLFNIYSRVYFVNNININRNKKPGKLHPIPPPEGPSQIIGIDYCGPFNRTTRGNRYVLEWVHLITTVKIHLSCSTSFIAIWYSIENISMYVWSLKSPLSNGIFGVFLHFTEPEKSAVYVQHLDLSLLSTLSLITTLN